MNNICICNCHKKGCFDYDYNKEPCCDLHHRQYIEEDGTIDKKEYDEINDWITGIKNGKYICDCHCHWTGWDVIHTNFITGCCDMTCLCYFNSKGVIDRERYGDLRKRISEGWKQKYKKNHKYKKFVEKWIDIHRYDESNYKMLAKRAIEEVGGTKLYDLFNIESHAWFAKNRWYGPEKEVKLWTNIPIENLLKINITPIIDCFLGRKKIQYREIRFGNNRASFIMPEMEIAAAKIIEKCQKEKTSDVIFSENYFEKGNEQNGFLGLLHYGWLNDDIKNDKYAPNEKFWNRIFCIKIKKKITQKPDKSKRVLPAKKFGDKEYK